MKKISYWGKPFALSALSLFAVGSFQVAPTAVFGSTATSTIEKSESNSFQSPRNFQVAQLVGQCRAAARTMDIFSQASVAPGSNIVRTLATNDRVTLSSNGDNSGWIQVSSPASGYVITRYIKPCSGTTPPPPPPPPGSCRRVVNPPEGLIVRSGGNSTAPQVGGVLLGEVVRVTGASNVDATGRTWVEITTPIRGWVSNGFPSGNLSAPFTCP